MRIGGPRPAASTGPAVVQQIVDSLPQPIAPPPRRAARKVTLKCRVCLKPDEPKNMFAPCSCYKKRETGLVHMHCLKALIETHQQRNDTATAPSCPICNDEFKGLRRRDIAWASLCSEKGFDVIFQCVTMCIMMVCCVFVGGLVIYDDSRPDDPAHPRKRNHQHLTSNEKRSFVFMGVLMLAMFVVTLKKVHERWTRVARPLVVDETEV